MIYCSVWCEWPDKKDTSYLFGTTLPFPPVAGMDVVFSPDVMTQRVALTIVKVRINAGYCAVPCEIDCVRSSDDTGTVDSFFDRLGANGFAA